MDKDAADNYIARVATVRGELSGIIRDTGTPSQDLAVIQTMFDKTMTLRNKAAKRFDSL